MEPLHACTTPTSVLAGQYASKRVAVGEDGETADLKIWDTAGQRKYRAITTAYYTGAAGVLLVYDVAAAPSFDECDAWLAVRRAWRRMRPLWTHPALYFHAPQEIRAHAAPGVPVVLVGNKVDLAEAGERAVEQDAARAFAEVRRVLAGCLRARDDPRRALPSRCRSTTSALLSVQRAAALACRRRSDSSPGQCGSVSKPRLRRPPPQRRRLSPQKNERFVPVGVKTCHWQLRDSGLPLDDAEYRTQCLVVLCLSPCVLYYLFVLCCSSASTFASPYLCRVRRGATRVPRLPQLPRNPLAKRHRGAGAAGAAGLSAVAVAARDATAGRRRLRCWRTPVGQRALQEGSRRHSQQQQQGRRREARSRQTGRQPRIHTRGD